MKVDECECVYDEVGFQIYECEWCYYQFNDKCTCFDGEIDVNCGECF